MPLEEGGKGEEQFILPIFTSRWRHCGASQCAPLTVPSQ